MMKINKEVIQKEKLIPNLLYESLKIEFLCHSNHVEGSTFVKKSFCFSYPLGC